MNRSRRTPLLRTWAAAAAALATAVSLAACAPATQPEPKTSPTIEATAWPRTIEIPAVRGGEPTSLTITAEPVAIAALDYESAEVLAELGLAGRLVLVPEAVLNSALGGHVDEMADVATTFPVAGDLSAEMVIATAPDLVVMSPRHGADDTVGSVLTQSGMTVLQLPTSWTSPETLASNIDLIGQATGADAQAAELTDAIESGLATNAASSADSDTEQDRPRVLVLTNQAGRAFVTAGRAFPLRLLELAGAVDASTDLGFERTGTISTEQVLEAAPDGLLLIDMNGTGDRMFRELLDNPAVASLPAASADRLMLISGRQVQALGLTDTADGLGALSEWVATL